MKDFLKKSALIVCASLLLFACKDEGGGETVVALNKTKIDLKVGQTETLKVAVIPETEAASLVWSSDNTSVATVDKGVVTAIKAGEAIITARVGEAFASCKVTVSSIPVTGITLDKESVTIPVGGTEVLTATVVPEDATDKTVIWKSSNTAVATVENGAVAAVAAGDAVITASIGEFSATCAISVFGAPKVGDYYYEDGTWSDGGLISIEAHGLNPVWATEKPAPKAGKTVIGIVFQTDQTRMNADDKAKGYMRGYVMGLKNVYKADDPTKTIAWSNDFEFSCLNGCKLASTWYKNVAGYQETMKVRDEYGPNLAKWMPAFDMVLNHYPLQAPATSSGWFLPSTGQMWDLMANLCGGGAATILKGWQTKSSDATWYCSEKTSYDALAFLNSMMSKIPETDKEVFVAIDKFHTYTSIWTSSPYDSESACQVNIGPDGLIELMCDWYDGGCYCRPILAF